MDGRGFTYATRGMGVVVAKTRESLILNLFLFNARYPITGLPTKYQPMLRIRADPDCYPSGGSRTLFSDFESKKQQSIKC
jgi:hypothetical protein